MKPATSRRGSAGRSQREIIQTVTATDVLLGRGHGPNDRIGNAQYRSLVRDAVPEYQTLSLHSDKTRIAKEIIAKVHARNGRFLRKLEADDIKELAGSAGLSASQAAALSGSGELELYEVVTNESVLVQKTKQAFRHCLRGTPPRRSKKAAAAQKEPVAAVSKTNKTAPPTSRPVPVAAISSASVSASSSASTDSERSTVHQKPDQTKSSNPTRTKIATNVPVARSEDTVGRNADALHANAVTELLRSTRQAQSPAIGASDVRADVKQPTGSGSESDQAALETELLAARRCMQQRILLMRQEQLRQQQQEHEQLRQEQLRQEEHASLLGATDRLRTLRATLQQEQRQAVLADLLKSNDPYIVQAAAEALISARAESVARTVSASAPSTLRAPLSEDAVADIVAGAPLQHEQAVLSRLLAQSPTSSTLSQHTELLQDVRSRILLRQAILEQQQQQRYQL